MEKLNVSEKTINLSDIDIPILVKIISLLDLKELKSLRLTNKHLRDMINKPIFWELYYRAVFGKALSKDNTFTWKDLLNLDNVITKGAKSIKSWTSAWHFVGKFMGINPQLAETYLRFLGIDMLDSTSPTEYFINYIYLYIYELNPFVFDEFLYKVDVTNLSAIVIRTPSRDLFQRILGLINEIDDDNDEDREDIIHIVIMGIVNELEWISTPDTVEDLLLKWRIWMRIIGLDTFLTGEVSLETVLHHLENTEIDEYSMKLMREFYGEFLK